MKKAIVAALLAFGLIAGVSVPVVFATEQMTQTKNGEGFEKALKTQVTLARTRVALLKAHSDLWLNSNKEAALRSLEAAKTYLYESYQDADLSTQRQITGLKRQVEDAKRAVRKKGQKASSELAGLVDRSEAALNLAVAETHTRASAVEESASTHLALVQAKASVLKAKIALELEQSPERAKQALAEAEAYLAEAKAGASQSAVRKISELENEARIVRGSVAGDVKKVRGKLDALIAHTGETLDSYGTRIRESEEIDLLRKRYAQLEAQAALMKARIAAEKEETYEQAQAYLEDARTWYAISKSRAKKAGLHRLEEMDKGIDAAKTTLKEKGRQARKRLSDLLMQAADMIEVKETK